MSGGMVLCPYLGLGGFTAERWLWGIFVTESAPKIRREFSAQKWWEPIPAAAASEGPSKQNAGSMVEDSWHIEFGTAVSTCLARPMVAGESLWVRSMCFFAIIGSSYEVHRTGCQMISYKV